jgi:hypothetical protein
MLLMLAEDADDDDDDDEDRQSGSCTWAREPFFVLLPAVGIVGTLYQTDDILLKIQIIASVTYWCITPAR